MVTLECPEPIVLCFYLYCDLYIIHCNMFVCVCVCAAVTKIQNLNIQNSVLPFSVCDLCLNLYVYMHIICLCDCGYMFMCKSVVILYIFVYN